MLQDDKLKQRPHKDGGTFDIRIQIYEVKRGMFRGKVRIRHSFEKHGAQYFVTDFKSASMTRTTEKAARKDAKALRVECLRTYTAAPQ